MDSMTKNIRKEALWQTMFANDVALGAREKDVLELELEQWREALEKRGMVETEGCRKTRLVYFGHVKRRDQ